MACERTGHWPLDQSHLHVRLIRKPQGGFRPIGLYRALYRLWGKARQGLVRDWFVTRCRTPTLAMAPGRTVGDALWRDKVTRVAEPTYTHTAECNWDIQKCFEHLRHSKLFESAIAHRYPLAVLRLSLLSYTWPRTLVAEGNL